MRILFLSRWYPYPPDNGSRIRVFNLVKQLSGHHDITLLSFAQEAVSRERLAQMEAYCRVINVVPYNEFSSTRLKAMLGFFSTRPRSLIETCSRDMQALVKEVSANSSFDVVVASQIDTAPYALLIDRTARVFEEVQLAVMYEQFARQHSLIPRVRHGLTWWKLSRFMARLLCDFAGCTVASERERDLMMTIMPEYDSLAVVPNGVDLETHTGDFGTPKPDTLIYSGALTYHANFGAMEFFLRDIFPMVKARRPNVNLQITGRYDGVPVEQLPLIDGVELTGYLDDIRSAVAQSWVCVVPLRVGGGTRLKILEAMALGTPVVSTTKGAEGLVIRPGENILIADEPAEFASATLRLLDDQTLREKLAINGRRLVRERYGWDQIGNKLDQLLYQVTQKYTQLGTG